MLDRLHLQHYTADEARELVDQLVDVYLDAHAKDGPLYNDHRYRRQLAAHVSRDGWALVAASVDGDLVGYIYGFPLSHDTKWWEGIQEPVPQGFTEEDGRRTFAVSELLVRPAWQRRGIARALHGEMIGRRAEQRATLLVRPDNAAAHAAYHSWGWSEAAQLQPSWKGAPTFDVLVRTIVVD